LREWPSRVRILGEREERCMVDVRIMLASFFLAGRLLEDVKEGWGACEERQRMVICPLYTVEHSDH
jgi:hypothetical protein